MGFAVLAFFYVVASSQIFPQINIAFLFRCAKVCNHSEKCNIFRLKKWKEEKSALIKDTSPLSTITFTSPLIIFSAELEVSLRVLAHRAKFGSFLTDMDMTAV